MENRPRDAAKSSLMIWRTEQQKKGAHEHFSSHTLFFEKLFLLQYLCGFTQCWQKCFGRGRTTVPLPTPGLKDDHFMPLSTAYPHVERDLGQWGWKRRRTELQRSGRATWQQSWRDNCWSLGWSLFQDVVTRAHTEFTGVEVTQGWRIL